MPKLDLNGVVLQADGFDLSTKRLASAQLRWLEGEAVAEETRRTLNFVIRGWQHIALAIVRNSHAVVMAGGDGFDFAILALGARFPVDAVLASEGGGVHTFETIVIDWKDRGEGA